jgi:hypothetical protein
MMHWFRELTSALDSDRGHGLRGTRERVSLLTPLPFLQGDQRRRNPASLRVKDASKRALFRPLNALRIQLRFQSNQ